MIGEVLFLPFMPLEHALPVIQSSQPALEADGRADHHPNESTSLFSVLIGMSRWQAWQIVGGLSRPSKMPCYAWGVPAQSCQVGSKLAAVKDSVCAACYALKGYFRMPKTKHAYQRRLDRSDDPQWVEAMVKLVYWQMAETGEPYFRWFDGGDLQSVEMLRRIVAVAKLTPEVWHWLPTREYRMLAQYLASDSFPPNLVVRVSAPLVDGSAPEQFGLPTSTVHSEKAAQGFACTAYDSRPPNCGECRVCWDPGVGNVSYPLH